MRKLGHQGVTGPVIPLQHGRDVEGAKVNAAVIRRLMGLLWVGTLVHCGGNGCMNESRDRVEASVSAHPPKAPRLDPPPVRPGGAMEAEGDEGPKLGLEFQRFLSATEACTKTGTGCGPASRLGRRMARRAIRLEKTDRGERLQGLWRRVLGGLRSTTRGRIRDELALVGSLIERSAEKHVNVLLQVLAKETRPVAAKRMAGIVGSHLGSLETEEMAQVRLYLARMEPENAGLAAGQRVLWTAVSQWRSDDAALRELARKHRVAHPDKVLRVLLTRWMRRFSQTPEERTAAVKSLISSMHEASGPGQESQAAASVEALGDLGGTQATGAIVKAIDQRRSEVRFLPSAALALFQLAKRQAGAVDREAIVGAARQILSVEGLSLVAYRNAIYAIRDSRHPTASQVLKTLLGGDNKVIRRLAVEAFLRVKREPSHVVGEGLP